MTAPVPATSPLTQQSLAGFFIERATRQDWDDLQGLVSRMFAGVMTSIVDLALQNPSRAPEPTPRSPATLPSYGAMLPSADPKCPGGGRQWTSLSACTT
ncbi:hypothetical protein OG331_46425 [Streptomyces sp. NBC_01017]|uniref:hypothetical protein n=1 Tax=Streptomyces sp. NBC_01017 TaxID=2903721 RepID=UPI00386E015F|nr:hypothetical protein OG331_46425 [Streptomyces sp. NBC_01017]